MSVKHIQAHYFQWGWLQNFQQINVKNKDSYRILVSDEVYQTVLLFLAKFSPWSGGEVDLTGHSPWDVNSTTFTAKYKIGERSKAREWISWYLLKTYWAILVKGNDSASRLIIHFPCNRRSLWTNVRTLYLTWWRLVGTTTLYHHQIFLWNCPGVPNWSHLCRGHFWI